MRQPLHGTRDTDLHLGLRAGGIRHRSDHGRAGARFARLCLRPSFRTGNHARRRRRRHQQRVLRRQGGQTHQLRFSGRHGGQGGDRKMFDAIEQRGLGKRWSTTDCATPSSRASVTGENPSRSTIATKSPARCRNRRCRSNCRPSATSAPRQRANRRWPAQRGGRRPTAIRSNCRRCPVRRFVRLLPALHGPAQRPRARRPRSGRILAVGRPLRGRHRTCDGPPDVFALLEHVPLRSGLRVRARTLPEAGQPGHDPGPLEFRLPRRRYQQVRLVRPERVLRDAGDPRRREHRPQRPARSGRLPRMAARVRRRRVHPRRREIRLRLGDREDVEIDVQRRQPRLYRRPVRRRHVAHVRDVPRPARTVEAVGHERHRRRAQVPAPFLAALLRPATHWP